MTAPRPHFRHFKRHLRSFHRSPRPRRAAAAHDHLISPLASPAAGCGCARPSHFTARLARGGLRLRTTISFHRSPRPRRAAAAHDDLISPLASPATGCGCARRSHFTARLARDGLRLRTTISFHRSPRPRRAAAAHDDLISPLASPATGCGCARRSHFTARLARDGLRLRTTISFHRSPRPRRAAAAHDHLISPLASPATGCGCARPSHFTARLARDGLRLRTTISFHRSPRPRRAAAAHDHLISPLASPATGCGCARPSHFTARLARDGLRLRTTISFHRSPRPRRAAAAHDHLISPLASPAAGCGCARPSHFTARLARGGLRLRTTISFHRSPRPRRAAAAHDHLISPLASPAAGCGCARLSHFTARLAARRISARTATTHHRAQLDRVVVGDHLVGGDEGVAANHQHGLGNDLELAQDVLHPPPAGDLDLALRVSQDDFHGSEWRALGSIRGWPGLGTRSSITWESRMALDLTELAEMDAIVLRLEQPPLGEVEIAETEVLENQPLGVEARQLLNGRPAALTGGLHGRDQLTDRLPVLGPDHRGRLAGAGWPRRQ